MEQTLYQVTRTRKQRARLLLRMAIGCWVYLGGFYWYDTYSGTPTFFNEDGWILLTAFGVASAILTAFALWNRFNPATYTATITTERFTVYYPGSTKWSFDVAIADIKRFEHRVSLSSAGRGRPRAGILLHDGTFHDISLNYFNGTGKLRDLTDGGVVGDMHRAVQQANPEIPYRQKENTRVEGFLKRDYSD